MEIRQTEIMSPFRDTMNFIYHTICKINIGFSHRAQDISKAVNAKSFR